MTWHDTIGQWSNGHASMATYLKNEDYRKKVQKRALNLRIFDTIPCYHISFCPKLPKAVHH